MTRESIAEKFMLNRLKWSRLHPASSALALLGIAITAALAIAQTPASGPPNGAMVSFTATSDNVSGANDSIRIDLLRWSTDAERDQLITA